MLPHAEHNETPISVPIRPMTDPCRADNDVRLRRIQTFRTAERCMIL